MFLDASAVVAILTGETQASALIGRISNSRTPISYSSITVFEAVIAISRKNAVSLYGSQRPTPPDLIVEAQRDVDDFMVGIGAVEIAIEAGTHRAALAAARTYGRFVGHPAKLNFGDCFTYAAAKSLNTPLLFVGADFSKTDIAVA
ncbi:type II toxin-antitoxin system VapC family toxin [Neorhizobium alkalisoli]|uniref:Ribonuclease VapC n=1 Tax=Neorhizobium alkalisoli TaxID=528178 RepID=A0A561QIK4_9HYPH|nr:type II toxin-antitoxin system VapC family toxin [Neorhizobium alkalisoli]TWF50198.1 ribonuclease VapC [Neorhizobium alkalisoli]